MPYVRKGKCCFHQNPDGSAGAKIGCSKSVPEAKLYLKALYVHMPKGEKAAGTPKKKDMSEAQEKRLGKK